MATAKPDRVRYLTFADLQTLASELSPHLSDQDVVVSLQTLGGDSGAGVLRGILDLPRQSVGGKPAYPTIFEKAAVLLRSIALNHPFVDGNKRMALGSALLFLSVNGWLVRAPDDELRDLTLDVVLGRQRRLDKIADWLKSKSVAYDEEM